ncbi:hypothetical protein MSC49_38100 (plasmid) [Methylosinus sp. C49]|jgi:hypothetical protein|uniref:hypothetical protein n=1 Tax=Methylosinus sp. C49 TaxID=2699395 RepID=UPI001366F8BE|nr:hypothetical protein [Methylosinus sp. C49]BBU63875.1 hypothetical protein MSC49_38100 [Methylosinus sp. C49]
MSKQKAAALIARNPGAAKGKAALNGALALIKQLREQGIPPSGYDLSPPFSDRGERRQNLGTLREPVGAAFKKTLNA